MNFRQLKDRLRLALKNPDTIDDPDIDLGGYVNSGYTDLAGRFAYHQTRKRTSFTTEAGYHRYELPCDLTALLRVMDVVAGQKLIKMGDRYLASRRNELQYPPSRYIRYRNYIELIPTPNDAREIELFYIAVPCMLETDEDIPVLPVTWHDGIVLRAKWYYWMDKGDQAQTAFAFNNFNVWVADKPNEIEEESVDIDSGVEMPTLSRGYGRGWHSSRFDDGGFDYREGR